MLLPYIPDGLFDYVFKSRGRKWNVGFFSSPRPGAKYTANQVIYCTFTGRPYEYRKPVGWRTEFTINEACYFSTNKIILQCFSKLVRHTAQVYKC